MRVLLEDPALRVEVTNLVDGLGRQVTELESALDAGLDAGLVGADLEQVNASIVLAKDGLWAIRRDRLRAADGVAELLAGLVESTPAAIAIALSIHQALSALDRLEVRGRDSAGLHLLGVG